SDGDGYGLAHREGMGSRFQPQLDQIRSNGRLDVPQLEADLTGAVQIAKAIKQLEPKTVVAELPQMQMAGDRQVEPFGFPTFNVDRLVNTGKSPRMLIRKHQVVPVRPYEAGRVRTRERQPLPVKFKAANPNRELVPVPNLEFRPNGLCDPVMVAVGV